MANVWLGLKLSFLLTAGGLNWVAEAAGAQPASEAGPLKTLKAAAANASPASLVTGTALFLSAHEAIAARPSSFVVPTNRPARLAQADRQRVV